MQGLSFKNEGALPQMVAGVHLVTIVAIKALKDSNGNPQVNKNQEPGIIIVFKSDSTDSQEELFIERICWLGGKCQWVVDKMLSQIGVDNSQGPVSIKVAIGKQLWIGVKEIRTINQETGECSSRYEVLDTYLYSPSGIKPVISDSLLVEQKVIERPSFTPISELVVIEKSEDGKPLMSVQFGTVDLEKTNDLPLQVPEF